MIEPPRVPTWWVVVRTDGLAHLVEAISEPAAIAAVSTAHDRPAEDYRAQPLHRFLSPRS